MNAKTARKLRKIAAGMVVAAEQQGQTIDKVAHKIHPRTGNIMVSEKSWKGAYKALKKGLQKSERGDAFSKSLASVADRKRAVQDTEIVQIPAL